MYTWGDKENGVVGHTNADGHQYLPRMLESLQAKVVKQVAACGFHTAALTDVGEIFTWGEGENCNTARQCNTYKIASPLSLRSYLPPPLALSCAGLVQVIYRIFT